ncbi:MAG: hypothetical protein AAB495_01490 [Patescibacteria group bacterium]
MCLAVGFMAVLGWLFYARPIPRLFLQNPSPVSTTSFLPVAQTNSTPGFKTYRNAEYGFEFQYPEGWKLEENSFRSPFSKFNIIGVAPKEAVPNTIVPSMLVNIVEPDFAARASLGFRNLGATTSIVVVGGVEGTRYEYDLSGISQISINLPFGDHRMLLGASKQHENTFNQTLSSFKFLR